MEQQPKDFSQGTKFTAIFGVVIVVGAVYFGVQVLGDTTFNLTLRSNQQLEDGLIAHWSFDSDTIGTSTISDSIGGFTGTHISFASSTTYSTSGTETVVVPSGVTVMRIKLWGAGGGGGTGTRSGSCASGFGLAIGGAGGGGGFAQADISVTPSESLTLEVGAAGTAGSNPDGGGYTAFRRTSTYLVQAGGGGGGGGALCQLTEGSAIAGAGGAGGGTSGVAGSNGDDGNGGGGGTSSAGGTGGSGGGSGTDGSDGAANAGGDGGSSGTCGTAGTGCGGNGANRGGGGGGGRFGGGGGEGTTTSGDQGGGGGGGGSSLVTGSNTVETAGSGTTPGNSTDADRPGSAGSGGSGGANSAGTSGQAGGAVLFSLGTSTTATAAGRIGQGVELDGDNYAKISGLLGTPTDVTLAAWVNLDEYDASGSEVVSLGDYVALRLSSGSARGFFRNQSGSWSALNDDTVDFAGDGWHHMVFTFDDSGDTQNLYLDGTLATTSAYTDSIDWAAGLGSDTYIGKHGNGSNNFNFDGNIDDVRVYNRALSAREVTRLYGLGATTEINKTVTSNKTLDSGLVTHWSFDSLDVDLSQVTAEIRDRTSTANHANWIDHATTTRAGRIGQGIDLDGTNDYIDGGTDLQNSFTSFTIAQWVKLDDLDVNHPLFFNLNGQNLYPRGRIQTNGSGWLQLQTGGSTQSYATNAGAVTVGTWYHVAFTFDESDNSSNIYIDGSSAASNTFTAGALNGGTSGSFFVGHDSNAATYVDGVIDDVRVYNRALSASEVKRLYQLGATTRINTIITTNTSLTSDLAGYWSFDGSTVGTSTVTDLSGNSNTGLYIVNAFGPGTSYPSSGTTTLTIPEGVSQVRAKLWGAGGGGGDASTGSSCTSFGTASGHAGGGGGFAQADVSATAGEELTLEVGSGGSNVSGGRGGGYTALRRTSTYLVQAGGGGGGGAAFCNTSGGSASGGAGGAGGGTSGVAGGSGTGAGGGAGTTSAGGTGGSGGSGVDGSDGIANQGGNGGSTGTCGSGGTGCGGNASDRAGGGGGGRFGGGGGEGDGTGTEIGGGGGGGGSSLVTGTNTTETAGSGTTPGNSGDADRPGSAGNGGAGALAFGANAFNDGGSGSDGGAVIFYYFATSTVEATAGRIGQAVEFDGITKYIDIGNVGSGIKTAAFWIKVATSTSNQKILDFDGTDQIETDGSSNVTATSWPATATVYVDGSSASATLTKGWHHVAVTTTDGTGVNASDFDIGRIETEGYCGCSIDDVRLFTRTLTATEVQRLYELGS